MYFNVLSDISLKLLELPFVHYTVLAWLLGGQFVDDGFEGMQLFNGTIDWLKIDGDVCRLKSVEGVFVEVIYLVLQGEMESHAVSLIHI